MPTPMVVICDKCKLKRELFHDADADETFMRRHRQHVFNGLRVMERDFPCPNAQRRYAYSDAGDPA